MCERGRVFIVFLWYSNTKAFIFVSFHRAPFHASQERVRLNTCAKEKQFDLGYKGDGSERERCESEE